jgi:hypothetical protein
MAVKTGMEQTSMTKVLKVLGAGSLAAVLGLFLLGLSGTFGATRVAAESPPAPAARFTGTVLVDGKAPVAGTSVVAKIGSSTCGATTTFANGAESRYRVDSPALDPGAAPNCGVDGAAVTFFVDGNKADQSGTWRNYDLNQLNLTVTTPKSPTPKPPSTGSIVASDGSAATWLFAILGLGALAFTASGVAVARRGR